MPVERVLGRRQPPGELAQLGCRVRHAAAPRPLRTGLDRRRHVAVGPGRTEREVSRALLRVGQHRSESAMSLPSLLLIGAPIAGGGIEGVRESDASAVWDEEPERQGAPDVG